MCTYINYIIGWTIYSTLGQFNFFLVNISEIWFHFFSGLFFTLFGQFLINSDQNTGN